MVSPEYTTVEEGRSVTLFCFAVGTPLRAAEWFKDGASISDGGRFNVSNGMLQINSTILQDSGTYNCFNKASTRLTVYSKNVKCQGQMITLYSSSFFRKAVR